MIRPARVPLLLWRPSATSAARGASCDHVGQLTPALLLRRERGHPAPLDRAFRSGRISTALEIASARRPLRRHCDSELIGPLPARRCSGNGRRYLAARSAAILQTIGRCRFGRQARVPEAGGGALLLVDSEAAVAEIGSICCARSRLASAVVDEPESGSAANTWVGSRSGRGREVSRTAA